MEADDGPTPGTDELIERIGETVAQRREDGRYPEGLEHGLDHEGPRPTPSPPAPVTVEPLRHRIEGLRQLSSLDPARIPIASRVPGGRALHRAAAKAVSRQTHGIMDQVRSFAQAATSLIESVVSLVDDRQREMAGQLDAVLQRVARTERASLGPEADLADLRNRVEQLEAAEAGRGFRPWFASERFEAHFRGSREELLDRYRDLAARFEGRGPVLDIGCGRGEFLELLAQLGVEASGVEVDPDLVQAAQARGLDVSLGDAADVLARAPDGSLGGIVLIQVVEHLTAQGLLELIVLAADKLRSGGLLVMETVNPRSLYVFANSFYIDPTHSRPIHPAYLEFLCREAGFATIETEWRSAPPDEDRLQEIEPLPELDANIERLNGLLWAPGDYAIIASR